MIENLRRIYKQIVKQVLNQQALTGVETPLHRRLFLLFQLNQILTGLILTVISSLYGGVTSHPRVGTRASAVTWMWSDNGCTRLCLYLRQLWYLVLDENFLSLSFLPLAFPQWLEWSWIWRHGWTNLRSWPAMCPTVGRAHTRYEIAPPAIDCQLDFVYWLKCSEILFSFHNLHCSVGHPEVVRWTVKWTLM